MDLIISVDTAILHLAGAMGKKTWAVLPYSPDWRWGTDGDTTRWYPSMRLYRQTNPSSWSDVFDRMAQDLC
jgi:ADP-heptose:LPS heptosyltransferase